MLTIGCHLSKRRGYLEMAKEAASINANTFQYFTRSPRGSEQAALDEKDVAAYLAFAKEHGIHDALAYAPYDADPATDKMNERDFALMVYSEDLARLAEVDGSLYLIRPGSRLNISVEEGLADVADALNKIITPSMKTCVLLDTMAGEGTQVGTSFEQLAAIIAKVEHPEHVGVCFDCAGVWAEGYDIVGDLDGVLEEFDRTIGLNKLKAVHLNDATHERGSHVDRHARIGEGKIGFDALAALVNHPKLAGVPFYLEEPDSTSLDSRRPTRGRSPARQLHHEKASAESILGAGLLSLGKWRSGKTASACGGRERRKAHRKPAAPARSPGPGRERPQQDGRLRRGAQKLLPRGPGSTRKSAGPRRPPGRDGPGEPPVRQPRGPRRRAPPRGEPCVTSCDRAPQWVAARPGRPAPRHPPPTAPASGCCWASSRCRPERAGAHGLEALRPKERPRRPERRFAEARKRQRGCPLASEPPPLAAAWAHQPKRQRRPTPEQELALALPPSPGYRSCGPRWRGAR
ncbi:deoxyribonuclease IV [Adlercreutzia rubneri]